MAVEMEGNRTREFVRLRTFRRKSILENAPSRFQ